MKTTDNLKQELMQTTDLSRFLSENRDNFNHDSVGTLLFRLFEQKDISKAALAKASCMSEVYLHQIFAGRRTPTRSRLICLCFGLGATLEETQEFLRQCGFAQLYSKNRRDAIIIYALINAMPLPDVNDKLFCEGEETLY